MNQTLNESDAKLIMQMQDESGSILIRCKMNPK